MNDFLPSFASQFVPQPTLQSEHESSFAASPLRPNFEVGRGRATPQLLAWARAGCVDEDEWTEVAVVGSLLGPLVCIVRIFAEEEKQCSRREVVLGSNEATCVEKN